MLSAGRVFQAARRESPPRPFLLFHFDQTGRGIDDLKSRIDHISQILPLSEFTPFCPFVVKNLHLRSRAVEIWSIPQTILGYVSFRALLVASILSASFLLIKSRSEMLYTRL